MKSTESFRFFDWFILNWSRTTLPIAGILLFFSPLIFEKLGLLLFIVFLQLPAYMIHQYEEHAHGKFKAHITNMMGQEALSDRDIFYINILLVWVMDIIALYLAVYVHIWFGLIAAYMPAFNGITHIAASIKMRKYNPGVLTSIFIFLPVGCFGIYLISQTAKVSVLHHAIALGITLLAHAAIIVRVKLNLKKKN
jgi:Protein of unknown function with HXXEE motif